MKTRQSIRAALAAIFMAGAHSVSACDLCAINNATVSRSEASGFSFTLGEQYISSETTQLRGKEIQLPNPAFLHNSITHIIPGYNFNRDLGLSLNIPIVRREFDFQNYYFNRRYKDTTAGLGDISLVGRWTPWSLQEMSHSLRFNLFAGVKLPTGDARYVRDDVAEEKAIDQFAGVNHEHLYSGVRLHDLALGSGSVDAVFGVTMNARWKRLFASAEAQYYLRTEGEADFTFGDMVMVSGGPGVYLVSKKNFTLSLQGVGRFENSERADYGYKLSSQTGLREIYAGPDIGMSIGRHFSGKIGADIPIDIRNSGLQTVADFRAHASLTWSF
jgi:hypothetical protein